MFTLPKGKDVGQWWDINDYFKEVWKAIVCCPSCGTCSSLKHYDVYDNGEVSPDFKCNGSSCKFSSKIKLDGWISNYVSERAHTSSRSY